MKKETTTPETTSTEVATESKAFQANKIEEAIAEIPKPEKSLSMYSNMASFMDGQRIARMLSESDLVPKVYYKNLPNTMLALEMSNRVGISPFMVMQNLDIIQGKPGWRSTFIIAALNSCGRFEHLEFEFSGTEPTKTIPRPADYGCRAVTKSIKSGREIKGPKVTWEMVIAEEWVSKKGSKWKTMPELMFQYRCAAFFGRLHAPDILIGMQTAEENIDTSYQKEDTSDRETEELKKRVIKHIKISNSIEQLEDCESSINDDETRELYNARMSELKN